MKTRRSTKISHPIESESEEEEPRKKPRKAAVKKAKKPKKEDGTSSDSSVDDYLQPADEIDLTSSFFDVQKAEEAASFDKVEKNILCGVDHLSDTDSNESDGDLDEVQVASEQEQIPTVSLQNSFDQSEDFSRKLEETKRHVEKYKAANKNKQECSVDILKLLAAGESKSTADQPVLEATLSGDSDSEWEEVEGKQQEEVKPPVEIPKEGVQITVEMPGVIRTKKGTDLFAAMKRRINRIRKENQIFVHKVSLLTWIAHGNAVNAVLNDEKLMSACLKLIPSQDCYPDGRTDIAYLEMVVKWFVKAVKHYEGDCKNVGKLLDSLTEQICAKTVKCKKYLVYLFVSLIRSLGIQCRLVVSFRCLPLRPPNSELMSLSTKTDDKSKEKKTVKKEKVEKEPGRRSSGNKEPDKKGKINLSKLKNDSNKPSTSHSASPVKSISKSVKSQKTSSEKEREPPRTSSSRESKTSKTTSARKDSNSSKASKPSVEKIAKPSRGTTASNTQKPSSKTSKSEGSSSKSRHSSSISTRSSKSSTTKLHQKLAEKPVKISQLDGADDLTPPTKKKLSFLKLKGSNSDEAECSSQRMPKRKSSSAAKYTEPASDEDFQSDESSAKKSQKQETKAPAKKTISKSKSRSDADYIPVSSKVKKKKPQKSSPCGSENEFDVKAKERAKVNLKKLSDSAKRYQVLSSDTEEDASLKKKKGMDYWVEVFLESEEKWISVDIVRGQVHCISELCSRASSPVCYVVAWNNDQSLKDVSQRYCPQWNTVTRKLRVDPVWWEETMKPFLGKKTPRDREEDEDLMRQHVEKPLPTTISEYKNHPLYVLKRHLLKFETIYPADSLILGFCRNEPVYSRDCVHVLHAREYWLRMAKVVKIGEKPYKIVKARPKYDKLSGKLLTDLPLEVFGPWQVKDYEPPVAENGVVPRNAYGNVELFKPTMLPVGTVHLQLPGLNKVAKKLNIDCAPAVIGFDFHSGGCHPTYDGFVVCEEYEDLLVSAWQEDQDESERRAREKFEKRVYGNWKRLIKGLLIRERLKAKYDFGEMPSTSGRKDSKKMKVVMKKRRICSDSESD